MSAAETLCIDFGTSSIRAALRELGKSRPRALELGEAFRSSIDRASIPSAIFIDPDGSSITFGEEALKRGLKGERSLMFETSPKRWMSTESHSLLDSAAIQSSRVTRKHLLAGLLAQSFSAVKKATGLSKEELLEIETRVAHPVWNSDRQSILTRCLADVTAVGRHIAGLTDKAVSPELLLEAVDEAKNKVFESAFVDVEEPVAAALELFGNSDNAREICVVVDVGAGTTDLGIFLSLTPDEQAKNHRRKFIQAAPPRSIYMAGDTIDEEVINLIKSRAKNLSIDTLQDLQRRRRNIKETLFSRASKVYEAGVELSLKELEGQQRIIQMRNELSVNFKRLVGQASSFIQTFVEATFHPADRINVVFAGGGGNIGFLHEAIDKSIHISRGRSVPITIRAAASADRTLPATVERLAVALGGTTSSDSWPITKVGGAAALKTKWDLGTHSSLGLKASSGQKDVDWWRERR